MKQVICPTCGAKSYRDDAFKGDARCTQCVQDSLKKLNQNELRNLAKDSAIVGYSWLGNRTLISYLTKQQPKFMKVILKPVDGFFRLRSSLLPSSNSNLKRNKPKEQIVLTPKPTTIKIRNLSTFYWQAYNEVIREKNLKNPRSFVNENLLIVCPECGLIYNKHDIDIAVLDAVKGIGKAMVISLGGMYYRCLNGICPNGDCSSRTATIIWCHSSDFEKIVLNKKQNKWNRYETEGFNISCPSDWFYENTEQGLEIYPNHKPGTFDKKLKKFVTSPGVNIGVWTLKKGPNYVVEMIIGREKECYERYKFIKFFRNEINSHNPAAIYEFQYGTKRNRFTAISHLKQQNKEFYNITASADSKDFELYRDTIEGIIFSFNVNI